MNQIRDEGALAIGRALERNQVKSIFSFFISITILYIYYRRSPHLTLNGIKSKLQVHKQLLKHYKEIKLDTHLILSRLSLVFYVSYRR